MIVLELLQGLVAVLCPLELRVFPQKLKERPAFAGSSADEVVERSSHAGQPLNLLCRGRTLQLLDCRDLVQICFDPSPCDQASQELVGADTECAFGWV